MTPGYFTSLHSRFGQEHRSLVQMIHRKFKHSGDVESALEMVRGSKGIERTRELAAHHAQQAADCIRQLPPASSEYTLGCREGLIRLTEIVLDRKK